MPEGKKPAEDLYSAKTHLHQPVPEVSTVNATALPADAPEGALPSEVRPEIVTWEKLCEAIKASGKAYNMEMITKAYDLANKAHNGVCRRSGEPYICHPLAVARLVLDLGMDSESIAAALLHDVVEDTPTTLEDLTAAFGEEVALLVDGVTKLTKIQFSNIEELQAENLRKMLLAMTRSSQGIALTVDGAEFLTYARQVLDQADLLEERYKHAKPRKQLCQVSTQHYMFAVEAFVEMINSIKSDEYEFTIRETRTRDIINQVANMQSEIGIIYLSDFNKDVIGKLLREKHLEFHPLFRAPLHVFMKILIMQ